MKITPLFAFVAALFVALATPQAARADDVTFDVFYKSLSDEGEWYNTPEYGYVFQPDVSYNNDKWRPYTDGYWAQTEDGWTWVSYENFGWATYHYGRWTRLKDIGWAWVPGYEWGPGWVSWRANEDQIGWAPLPPAADRVGPGGDEAEAAPARSVVSVDYNDVEPDYSVGYTPAVDAEYGIGPDAYCFVETRRFGDPRLSEVILPPIENITYIENTTNITYINYRSENDRRVIFNRGPDFAFVREHSERPIQELRIERHDDAGYLANGLRNGGNANRVHDGVLQVAAPAIAHRAMDFQQLKPNKVKRTIEKPEVVRGWQGVDPERVSKAREVVKQQAQAPAAPGAPLTGHTPRVANTPASPAPAAVTPPAVPGSGTEDERSARRAARQKLHEGAGTPQEPAAATQPTAPAPAANDAAAAKAERKAAHQKALQQQQPQEAAAPVTPPPAEQPQDKAARKAAHQQALQQQQQQQPPQQAPAPEAPQNPDKAARKAAHQQQLEQLQQQQPAQPAQPPQATDDRAARKAAHQQEVEEAARVGAAQQQQRSQAEEAAKAARQAARQASKQPQPQPSQAAGDKKNPNQQ